MRLAAEQFDHWDEHGYVVASAFFSAEEVARAADDLLAQTPHPDTPTPPPNPFFSRDDFFPFPSEAANALVAHDAILDVVEQVTGCEEIVLSIANAVVKHAGAANFDQPLHCDYPNNTVVFPDDSQGRFRNVGVIVYLTDVTEELGPTYVVSQQHYVGDPLHQSLRSRPDDLYQHEIPVVGPAGTVLFYGLRTFHRGSQMSAGQGHRITLHPVYLPADAYWMQRAGFAAEAGSPTFQRFIQKATPRQRRLVDFPLPGHPYWTEQTLAGVAARYPGADLRPYREGLLATR